MALVKVIVSEVDGVELGYPTEASPATDYVAVKGLAFENLNNFLIEKLGRTIVEYFPSTYQSIVYTDSIPTAVEYFNSTSFVQANRIARRDLIYSGDLITSESLKIYDATGATVLRTYTWTHSYVGSDLSTSGLVIT